MRGPLLLAVALAPLFTPLARADAPRRASAQPVAAQPVAAEPGPDRRMITPRVEERPGLGRLVLPAPGHGGYRVTQDGGKLVITMPPGVQMTDVAHASRNVASVTSTATATEISAVPGARIRTSRGGGTLVIDVLDPPRASRPPGRIAAAQPQATSKPISASTSRPATAPLGPTTPTLPTPGPVAASGPVSGPATAPVMPVRAETLAPPVEPAQPPRPAMTSVPAETARMGAVSAGAAPIADALPAPASAPVAMASGAVPIEAVADATEPTLLLPADRDVGLAAFRSGADLLVVLDAAIDFRPPESAPEAARDPALDPAFAHIESRRTEDATVIRIPAAPPGQLRLTRDARGWRVTLSRPRDNLASIEPRLVGTTPDAAYLRLPVSEPMRVVTLIDPQTGSKLLVGTQGVANEAVPNGRVYVQFSLLPTLQGVVVAATSDDIQLRREAGGFALVAGPHAGGGIISGAAPQAPGAPDAPPMSQLFELPNDRPDVLLRQLDDHIRSAANAPALARSAPRVRAAKAMIALGMGVEAQSVLEVAAAEDPALRDTPRFIGLRGVAAILAQRLEAADMLADPRLTGTVEVALWRSLAQEARGKLSEQDVRDLAAALPLVMAYPPTLRDRLLPKVLEALALNGAAAAVLKILPDDRNLDLVRGMALEMTNQPALALRAYDQVAGRPERLQRYKALVRGVELRMAQHELDARAAADALDRALFGWRGAQEELPLRLRIAHLRRQVGQWPEALTMLREARRAFPDDRAQVDQQIAATFTELFTGNAARRIAPADFVAFYDKNLDLVREMAWPTPLGLELVDHLNALDLQGRAEPVMARLVARSSDPAERAMLGARLAMVRMTLDDPAGAIDALAATVPPAAAAVGPAVMKARRLLYARAESARGNKDTALTMLAALPDAEADDARADIYAARQDWAGTIAALSDLERKRLPGADSSADTLTGEQQAIVMRIAEAATLGADDATLARLTQRYGASMAKGGSAALFGLFTSAPVRGTADLPRAFEEIRLARQLPGGMATARP